MKAKIISISSGKGGVGKTCTSVNLAILLARQGYKVCLFDADANLANVNIMLKLVPELTLHHVISGQKSLSDITLHKAGIDIIPGASGLTDFMSLTAVQQKNLLNTMQELKSKYDYLFIDNPAGINENILSYIKFSDHAIIVISPEPTSLTDAFALVRVLHKRGSDKILNVIVNNAPHEEYAFKLFNRFLAAVEKHIGSQLNYLGYVATDKKIATSICLQNPVVLQFPTAPSARNYNTLSMKLSSLQKQTLVDKPRPSIETSPQQPDFSTNLTSLKKDLANKHTLIESPSTENLKIELINKIEDDKTEQATIKEILHQINTAYLKRFGHYVVDIPSLLHDAMKMDRISKVTIQNLIMTLHGLYQDQYGTPFETKVDSINPEPKEKNLKQETAELLINLLQKDNPEHTDTSIEEDKQRTEKRGPKLVPPPEASDNPNQDLIDSIRYASMVDK